MNRLRCHAVARVATAVLHGLLFGALMVPCASAMQRDAQHTPAAIGRAHAQARTGDLQPFRATYEVYLDGKRQGRSTLELERIARNRWRYSLSAEATRGLAGLGGFEATQVSEFVLRDGHPRLHRSVSTSAHLLGEREVRTHFDWKRGEARWSGDVKPEQTGPVPLTDDAINAHLLNLALALEVEGPVQPPRLQHRVLERGRARDTTYSVDDEERVQVPLGTFHATPLHSRDDAKDRTTTVWFAPGFPPAPLKVLQTERGVSKYELRLTRVETDS